MNRTFILIARARLLAAPLLAVGAQTVQAEGTRFRRRASGITTNTSCSSPFSAALFDTFARYGGEEFLLILVGTPLPLALQGAERIRNWMSGPLCQLR